MTPAAVEAPMRCSGAMSSRCDQSDLMLVVVGRGRSGEPRAMCSPCRAAATEIGLDVREISPVAGVDRAIASIPYAVREAARVEIRAVEPDPPVNVATELRELYAAIEERDALLMRAVEERDRVLLETIELELRGQRDRMTVELLRGRDEAMLRAAHRRDSYADGRRRLAAGGR